MQKLHVVVKKKKIMSIVSYCIISNTFNLLQDKKQSWWHVTYQKEGGTYGCVADIFTEVSLLVHHYTRRASISLEVALRWISLFFP